MLYQIYEAQRSLLEPFADMADAAAKAYGNRHTLLGQMPMAQRVSAAYALFHRLGKDYEKPEFGIRSVEVDGVEVAIHERIEIDKPFCQLLRFKRFSDDPATLTKLKGQPPVLIVAPLSGHYATLLRDTVRTMLEGHKVYITDWKNARMVPLSEGEFHLDDYVNYVQEFIRHLQGKYRNCHVISVCQPTVPVLAAVSLMASRGEKTPITMTMMGGPIDARKSPTQVNALAVQRSYEWFENNVIYRVPPNYPGAGRRVYPGFMQHTGFIAMNPDRHASSHYDYFKDLVKGDESSAESHRKFYDEYNAVLDMDADYYLETIKTVFQDFKLVYGTWDVRSPDGTLERVRPQDITGTQQLTVEGELDDISGSGQTRAAHTLCKGVPRREGDHLEVKGAGHYGIFSGRRWRTVVYPQVKSFIAEFHAKAMATQEIAPERVQPKLEHTPAAPLNGEAPKATTAAAPVATPRSNHTPSGSGAKSAVKRDSGAATRKATRTVWRTADGAAPMTTAQPSSAASGGKRPARGSAAKKAPAKTAGRTAAAR
ncbi:polyhydroxyalkanoate depolymerase [Ottowia testudinis]|uniref:Polyhydroxyalkanoate depolymerase n=1 Tax=Ottowia testudinis TaxID=2816950 RepID=A0A975CIP0_9BURK|nr:polyhydroxyalkanoate depolymerase [Ottowia testudinis]QTD46900.1 polyhydroxyalkanoate depolymerase [Ottowia testudinis]